MKFTGYHHIGLSVADGEKSTAFYCALGGKLIRSFPSYNGKVTITMVEMAPGAVVEIIPDPELAAEASPRWKHIALETDDCQAAFEKALSVGAKARVEPRRGKLGSMEVTNCFVTGPDGEDIEFFEVHEI